MANLIIEENLRHILTRAKERFGQNEEKARKVLEKVRGIVESDAPEDWRFTQSPSAKFIIAYEPEKEDFRLLGRTYRDFNSKGPEIIRRLSAPSLLSEELKTLINEYNELLLNPNCKIYHELKTIYRADQDLSDEKEIFQKVTSALPHIIPIDVKRIARRPNAIIANDEIWVRQGEYFDLSLGAKGDYKESLCFQHLTPKGVDKSKIHIYTLNRQGSLRFISEETLTGGSPLFLGIRKDSNLRGQSYWVLPTYVDAVYMDLNYARSQWQGDNESEIVLNAEKIVLLMRIEKLLNIVRQGV